MTGKISAAQTIFWRWILGLTRLQRGSLLVWVLVMIAFPIQLWIFGVEIVPISVSVNVVVQTAVVLILLRENWSWSRLAVVSVAVIIMTWSVEYLGKTTGVLFGAYSYSNKLQPQLLGVPVLIPLAWLMMLPPSWAVGRILADRLAAGKYHRFVHALLSGLAMTAWDLFLDPQMVHWGFWAWEPPGGFFGIPWTNYLGWLVVSTGITVIVRPGELPLFPLALVYTITMFLQAFGESFFWALPGPALAGLLLMGIFAVLSMLILGERKWS